MASSVESGRVRISTTGSNRLFLRERLDGGQTRCLFTGLFVRTAGRQTAL